MSAISQTDILFETEAALFEQILSVHLNLETHRTNTTLPHRGNSLKVEPARLLRPWAKLELFVLAWTEPELMLACFLVIKSYYIAR